MNVRSARSELAPGRTSRIYHDRSTDAHMGLTSMRATPLTDRPHMRRGRARFLIGHIESSNAAVSSEYLCQVDSANGAD
jgi:hypothetical protein